MCLFSFVGDGLIEYRDAEIINLLQQRLLQVVNGGELKKADNGVAAVQEDFKWNGFNKFY